MQTKAVVSSMKATFGFAVEEDTFDTLFLVPSNCAEFSELKEGDFITCDKGKSPRGFIAHNVKKVNGHEQSRHHQPA